MNNPPFSENPAIRVGMVLDQPFPPDARVEREAMALARAGFEVHLLCVSKTDSPADEYYQGFWIHRASPEALQYTIPLLNLQTRLPYTGLIQSLAHSWMHIDTTWHSLIHRFVRHYQIQILHIHDLRLVKTALHVKNNACSDMPLKLVADLHENYPALMQLLKGKTDPARGEKARIKWQKIEDEATQGSDHVITVIEEARERLIGGGLPPSKITVLPNTVDTEKFLQAPSNPEVTKRFKSRFLLTYVGHINGEHRGIHTVLEAMALLKEEMPELSFVGAGPVRDDYGRTLDALIKEHQLTDRVHFTGWLDETAFVPYIQAADICLCPHQQNDHTNNTFPNKVYLYHLFSKPVITSDCVPLKRYIDATQGGLVFRSGKAEELANCIRQLYSHQIQRKTLGEDGYQAVIKTYHWGNTEKTLLSLYQTLSQKSVPALVSV